MKLYENLEQKAFVIQSHILKIKEISTFRSYIHEHIKKFIISLYIIQIFNNLSQTYNHLNKPLCTKRLILLIVYI